MDPRQIAKSGRIAPGCQHRRLIADGSARIASKEKESDVKKYTEIDTERQEKKPKGQRD